jgi:hypothetical protein
MAPARQVWDGKGLTNNCKCVTGCEADFLLLPALWWKQHQQQQQQQQQTGDFVNFTGKFCA